MLVKILRPLLVALAMTLPVSFVAMAQGAPRFVSVIDDLPLMEGLVETGEGVEFSTPQGRLAESTASGMSKDGVTRKGVLDFYAQTLPQLGWKAQGATRFVREGETLDLVIGEHGATLSVRFSLAPTDK